MKKKLFVVSIISLLVGLILLASGMALGGISYLKDTNIDNLSGIISGTSPSYSKKTKELGDFNNMNVEFNYSDFSIKKSPNGKTYIEYVVRDDEDYTINMEKDTLHIYENRRRRNHAWIELDNLKTMLFNGRFNKPNEFTLYVSKNKFKDIIISNEMGFIDINGIESNRLTINNSMGLIKATECKTDECRIDQSMGKVELYNIKINNIIDAKNEMGEIDVRLQYDNTKYYNVDVSSEMGSVSIDPTFSNSNRLNEKQVDIIMKTEMGKISIKAE